jgi:zinc protease
MLTLLLLLVSPHLYFSIPLQAASKVSAFQLSNGLRVILAPVDHIKATCVFVYHLTGVRDDPPDIKGGSFLFQNLVLMGTQNLDRFERLVYIKRSGGISNRLVNYDYSTFSLVVPHTEIKNALWLEGERIGSLKLMDSSINSEKDKVYSRYYRINNVNVNIQSMNWIKSQIFTGTIYKEPIYGKLSDIKKFDPSAIRKLYQNFTNLSDTIMVISGKFVASEIRREVSKHFANLPARPKSRKKNFVMAGPKTDYTYKNSVIEGLSEPFVMFGIRAPSTLSHDFLYFDFIRYYLVDERISKLEAILNQTNNLDVSINHHFTNHYEANGLVIKIAVKTRVNLERVKYFVNRLLNALRKGKPGTLSSNDTKTTRSLMEIDFLKKMTSLEERSLFLAENYHFNGSLNSEERYLNRIRTINGYDIYRIGRKYLEKTNRVNLNVYAK